LDINFFNPKDQFSEMLRLPLKKKIYIYIYILGVQINFLLLPNLLPFAAKSNVYVCKRKLSIVKIVSIVPGRLSAS